MKFVYVRLHKGDSEIKKYAMQFLSSNSKRNHLRLSYEGIDFDAFGDSKLLNSDRMIDIKFLLYPQLIKLVTTPIICYTFSFNIRDCIVMGKQ